MQVIFQRNDLTILQLIINKRLLSLIYVQGVNNMAFPDLPWRFSYSFLLCKNVQVHTAPYIPLNLPLPFQLSPNGSGLASCPRVIEKENISELPFLFCSYTIDSLMNAPIFFCVLIHAPSNDLLTKNGHLKVIKIQRRLPNSDQIAHCNQRSYPNKRPPPLAKVAR